MQGRERVIEGFRLAPQQKRLWRLQKDSQAYYAQCAILIEGDIESGALEEALKKVMRKHEILRTTLDWFPGLETPIQLILEDPPLPYRRVDLNGKESGDVETVMSDLLREESRPFDLKRGLLARFCLSQLSASRQVLLISLHALCADGWTLRNLFKEITGFYAAELEGKELTDEPVQYLQFSEWQNELLEEKSDEAQIKGREPVCSVTELMLPLESSRAEISESNHPPFSPESAAFTLDPRMTSRIEAFGDARGSSVSGFLLACWQILLWRLSAKEEIIVGCLYDGRQFDELHDALGLFARRLPVRGTFAHDLRFDETVDRAMISLRQAHLSQEFFLRDSATREAADRINAISFEYEEWPEAKQVGPVRFSYWKQYSCLDRFKLKLGGYYKAEGLTIEIQYDPALFSRESVELFQERYLRSIESAIEREEALIGELEIIGRRELERLLVTWNRTEEKELDSDYLHELIASHARFRPESIAVIYKEDQLSYGELESRANQLANYLRSLGVGPDCVVGLYLGRSTEMIIGLLGILKAGGAYLPLEMGQPVERLRVMLEDAGARVIVTNPDVTWNQSVDGREVVMLYDGCQQIEAFSPEAPKVAVDSQNLAYVIYTSGSTGKPKGVMVRHGAVVNLWEWLKGAIYEGEGAAPTVSLNAPLAFDASVKQVVQLGSGSRLCIVPEEERVDAEFMLEHLRRNEVEVLDCTPSQLRMLVEAGLGKGESYSKVVLVGGEEIDRQSWGELSESREIEYYNVYGPTECTVDATACRVCVGMEPTIGRPIRNTQIYILDERGEVAPTGVVGEIYIGGAGLSRGYLGAAGMTAEKFTPNPFGRRDGERLYRTGDLGRYLVGGRIAYEGRRDEQVKVRGHRIELGEIEEVLRSYPGVSEAVVALREDELRQRQLVGYVVENAKGRMADLREEELRRYVRERLPSYMDLAAIVVMKELPLTKNGKVDRQHLPKPEAVRSEAQIEERRPRNAYEEIISGIWKQVLKVEPVRPGDNFFEIGGHSLLATQVISRVRNAFGVEIGVISIFQDATVEGLALRVEDAIKKGEKDEAPPLVRVSREGSLPLSFAQQRLWFIDQLEPGNAIYNCPSAVRVEGHLNLEALERAINEIIRRHEALRTRIEVKEGKPAQVIDEWKRWRIEVGDLTSLPQEEREEEARRIARDEAGTGFDLSLGPLLRVKALKLEEEQHVLLFTMHHIVGDGWSLGILSREVGELYRAYRVGGKSPFDELPIQYADFAVWQRAWLKGALLEAELEYWRNQLAGMEVLDFPTDYPRPATPSYRGARRRFVVGGELTERLRELSQQQGVTLFMTLLGVFEILMSRYSGQADVALGTDIANRNRAEIEGLIGFFVNQLVLRVEVRAAESVRELLKRVRAVCLEAYAHQDVPFEKLVEELQPERDLSRSPLFQVKLILQNAPGEDLELEGMRLRNYGGGELQTAKLDLMVTLTDAGAELVVVAEYSRDLFEEETIERLMSHYANVLMAIADDREKPIAELNLLSAAEREQIVVVWNETGRSYPQGWCAHELFTEQAVRAPERIALISEGQMVSYGALNRRANQLGRYLQRLGVGPEVVVGVCLERSVEMVIAVMGVLKAGGAYLPLDSEYPLERLSFMVEEAGVGAVMTQRKLEGRVPAFWGQMVLMDEEWERISEERKDEPESEVVAENLAYVIYTSGSTGRPKGVMVRHRGLCNLMEAQKEGFRLGEWSRVLQFASLSFDASVSEIFSTLGAGGSLRLSGREGLMGGDELARMVRDEQITTVTLPPTALGVLREEEWREVETVISAGEACSGEIVERWARGRRLLNAYGPTEATVCASIGECEEWRNGKPAIGRPIANTRLYILDREMETEPVGVRGELYIGGEGVGRGYLGRPELTAERFIPNRFSREGGERLYWTGDVCRYLSDGRIEYIGRRDEQVKVRGYRIELGEIEEALNEQQGVRQSVVVAVDDARGGRQLIGYVVGEEGMTGGELKRRLRERLPKYMVPESIVVLEEMPVGANGKVDRKRLSLAPSLKEAGGEAAWESIAARTPVEELLIGIFEEVLKLDRVGRRDNFFEIGGHSLLATQVVSRVRNAFGVEIEVGAIFEAATVEGLARKIEEAIRAGEKTEAPPLIRAPRDKRLPLSFAQRRLWFTDQLRPGNALYNCSGAVRLEGVLRLEVLERVVNEIVRRHEALRTRIEVAAGEPAQVIDEWEYRKLQVEDLSGLEGEEREEEVKRIAKEESGTGFDLSRGPLMRIRVLKLEEEQHAMLFTMHHIVSDAWSMGVLVREICDLYQAMGDGRESPLPDLAIQYADYAYWQNQYLTGAVLGKHLAYWKKQLSGNLPTLDLPADHPRPSVPSYRGAAKSFVFSPELAQSLKALSRREGVTTFMLLLSAFKTLLHKYSAQEDIIVGTPALNRNRAEIEPLIGFFVNMLPMRTNLRGNPRFSELLRRLKDVALGGYAHQDLPFERLVEEIQPKRSARQMPLFNVVFGVQNAPKEDLRLQGVRVRPVNAEQEKARFDLTVWVTESGESMQVSWVYSKDLFEEATVTRMHGHFETLLFNIVDRPDARLTTLKISAISAVRASYREEGDREDSELRKFISTKGRDANLSTEPA